MKIAAQLPDNRYQSKGELESAVKMLGDLNREKKRLETEANDKIAVIQSELAEKVAPYDAQIEHVANGIKFYCDSNREALFGKEKTATLITGSVSYRTLPASVSGKGLKKTADGILERTGLMSAFEKLLARFGKVFMRIKYEVNKDAILADPKKAKKLGYKIDEGAERFYVKPAEADAELEVAA
ncbi:MAG: host-nuclease inhibitor Gam family protein [Spirochaetes bacterium]|nr:host-nuclease inhibitor Gam family protein [Spirochaetota bacterium]